MLSVEISRPLSVAISMSSAHAVLTTMSMVGIWGVYAPTCRVGADVLRAEPDHPVLVGEPLGDLLVDRHLAAGDAVPRLLEVGDVGLA